MAYQKAIRRPDPRDVAPLLAALGDGTRREIVERLRRGRRTVGELAEGLPVTRPAVSQHLKGAARERRDRRRGARRRASLFFAESAGVDLLRRHFESMWQDVFLSFANYVKEAERARKSK